MDSVVHRSREAIEAGSKSFARAAKLFAPQTRDSVIMLYAWCRYCDDVVDGQVLGFRPIQDMPDTGDISERVAKLRDMTVEAYDGTPDLPEFQALARVVDKHDIPRRYPLDLIEGFAMDAAQKHYRTPDDTLSYCYHVAGVVGIMMAMVMGVRDKPTLQRACDLGIAFQLTNIARDVVADLELGRVYLPETWLEEAGVPRGGIVNARYRNAVFSVVDRVLTEADTYYDSAGYGIAKLPTRSAWAIASARRIYRAIGDEIRRRGPQALDARVSTSKRQKLRFVTEAGAEALTSTTLGRLRPEPPREQLWTPVALKDVVGVQVGRT